MKLIHRMILRSLPGPFLGWLGTLMFILLMQFLIRYLPDIAGKGLPLGAIIELIIYNLAYMLVLAVPMSALLASLMIFGRLAESNAFAVIKNSGISLPQLIWPTLIVGGVLAMGMTYFNNYVLPEANFRAKNLWQDIRSKQPGFELKPGIFYDGIDQYSILVQDLIPTSNELIDVTIYDYTEGTNQQAVIKARGGRLVPLQDSMYIDLLLHQGEIHRLMTNTSNDVTERYERLAFDRYRLRLDLSDFIFERSDPRQGSRSDRTTSTDAMIRFVDSLEVDIALEQAKLAEMTRLLLVDSSSQVLDTDRTRLPQPTALDTTALPPTRHKALEGLGMRQRQEVYDAALEDVRRTRAQVEQVHRFVRAKMDRIRGYRVEIHKKYSIAMACLIFLLIGAPLGLSTRRGGLGIVGALALGIFLFYWTTLVQGEKLADRGLLIPWVGMWVANIIMIVVGVWLVLFVALDLRATMRLRRRSSSKQ